MSLFEEEEEELQPMKPMGSGYTIDAFPNEELIMRKALYYDFMLYKRILKPFNSFLIKSGLQNSMYQQVPALPVIPALASSSNTTTSTVKNEDLLHESLQQFLAQKAQQAQKAQKAVVLDNIDTRVFILENLFKKNGLNNLFTPKTSEQINENIGMLVSNIAAGRTYDCSKDDIMSAIRNGRFDEYLSIENKEQMMRICGPVPVAEAAAAAATATSAATAQNEEKGFLKTLFGLGRRKMKHSKKRSKKRSKKFSKKRSNKRRRSIKRSKSNKKYKGGYKGMLNVAPQYIGSIQGKYMNLDGKQLIINPTGGIS